VTLSELQREFGAYLLEGDERLAAAVVGTSVMSSHSRMEIYANACRTRFIDALSADFPVLRLVLGSGPFEELSVAYMTAWPSTSFTLRDFGARMPSFIESRGSMPERAFAAELAAFEWALVEAFDAADHAAIGVDHMAAIPPEAWPSLEFIAHPSVRSVRTRFNTAGVWNAVKSQQPTPRIAEQNNTVACLVWRQGLSCVFRSMEPLEHSAWRTLAGGANFAAMCDALLDRLPPDEIPPRAAALLRGWLLDGLIATLRVP